VDPDLSDLGVGVLRIVVHLLLSLSQVLLDVGSRGGAVVSTSVRPAGIRLSVRSLLSGGLY